MSFTSLSKPQVQFLEDYLRGTSKSLSSPQAEATFGIQNLRARMTDLRNAGLRVRTTKNTRGRTSYRISRRDITGSQAKVY